MTGERQIELTWRCSSCGHRNLGRHVSCQGCGSPKDDSEEYEMPPDPSAAASVLDPRLLEMARAGANWRCRYCGSDQRTLAGTCAQCGSAQAEGESTALLQPRTVAAPRVVPRRGGRSLGLSITAAVGAALVMGVLGLCLMTRSASPAHAHLMRGARALDAPFRYELATINGISWTHRVVVERWQVQAGEGFEEQKPAEAFDVRPIGQRFHHNERVQDGFETQSYTETVPDGFRSESYTEREACGRDCRPRPQSCSEKCTNNKNGFASCRTVCTGGGQDCSTKYCNVQKTRQVPQTKTVQRTRMVPHYKDVPRNAPFYAWSLWGWQTARTLLESGTTAETTWPSDDEVKLGVGLERGEKERARRSQSYSVELATSSGPVKLELQSLAELTRLVPSKKQLVRVWKYGRVELL